VTETRFTNDGHLMRTVPERYSTALNLAGRSQWSTGRARWSSTPGTLSIKVPGEVYAERERDGRAEFQVVLFDAALVDDARAALDRPVVAPELHAIDGDDPRARPLLELHHQLLPENTIFSEPYAPFSVALTQAMIAHGYRVEAQDYNGDIEAIEIVGDRPVVAPDPRARGYGLVVAP